MRLEGDDSPQFACSLGLALTGKRVCEMKRRFLGMRGMRPPISMDSGGAGTYRINEQLTLIRIRLSSLRVHSRHSDR